MHNSTLRDIFQKIAFPQPPQGLEEKILYRINKIDEQQLRQAILITRVGRLVSFGAFVYAGFAFGHSVIASDFWQFASLLFSDVNIVTRYFSEFSLSLLETLPAFPIAIILAPLFSFLLFQFWSLNLGNVRHYTPLSVHA